MSKGDRVSIELGGGPPWGFRLGGGADFGCPLEIAKLRKKSKAFEAGLAEGDVVTIIDHQDVSSKSHGDAMKIIEQAGKTLKLEIIKGVGPSAGLSQMSTSQTDGGAMIGGFSEQKPAQATMVVSREPSVSNAVIDRPRERSTSRSRTLKVISANKPQADVSAAPVKPAHKPQADPWTVDVTSYQFANVSPAPQSLPNNQPVLAPAPRQPPPTSPKPRFKANTLPRSSGGSSGYAPVIPSWGAPPVEPNLQTASSPYNQSPVSSSPQAKAPMFKVAKVDAKPNKWQPTSVQNIDFNHPKHQFNGMMSPQPSQSVMSQSIHSEVSSAYSPVPQQNSYNQYQQQPHNQQYQQQPHNQQYQQPQHNQQYQQPQQHNSFSPNPAFSPQPVHQYVPEPPAMMGHKKPANHIPGMVNPLICDDSQGDFGANPLVRPDTVDGDESGKAKKMYSDSAFYDSPMTSYPTIQEQVAMAKEISSFLESNQNKRSRGGRMFSKRKNRAEEWVLNSQGQRRENQITQSYDSLDGGMPVFSMQRKEFGYNQVRHHPDPIKSRISAAELEHIQHNQNSLCKHDTLPPNIAFDINQALSQSHGKAGQFFEKRRQRAEKYVVDENNRRNWQPQNPNLQVQIEQPELMSPGGNKVYVSPWDAAADGRLDAAFPEAQQNMGYMQQSQPMGNGYSSSQHQPLNVITNQQQNTQPQLNVKYKTFKPVKTGFAASPASTFSSHTLPKPKTRLDMMLEQQAAPSPAPAASTLTLQQQPSSGFNNQPSGMMQSSPIAQHAPQYSHHPAAHAQSPYATQQPSQGQSSFSMGSLKRPKDYLQQSAQSRGLNSQNASVSAF